MSEELKREELREGMRVLKYDFMLGWVPGTMHVIRHAGQESLAFVMDGGQYAPSPTWPDSRFRRLEEAEGKMSDNEQMIRDCIETLKVHKIAVIPSNVSRWLKREGKVFDGSYDELSTLFWQIVDDPEKERWYKSITSYTE